MDLVPTAFTPSTIVKLGVLSSGFAAGYSSATSHLGVYSLLQSPGLTPGQISIAFDRIFTRGAKVFLPLVGISSLSYLYVAWVLRGSTRATFFGLSTPVQLTVASLSILATLPWTGIRMMPGIKRLRDVSSRAEKAPVDVNSNIVAVRADLEDWGWTNGVRGALLSLACILGATTL